MKTIVYELGSHKSLIYTVPAEKAVVDAYYQHGLNNYNTWEYDYSLVRYSVSARTVYCGDFAAKAE